MACTSLWHFLHMDNWYSSVELSEALLAQQIHTVSILCCNRGEPSKIRKEKCLRSHDVNCQRQWENDGPCLTR